MRYIGYGKVKLNSTYLNNFISLNANYCGYQMHMPNVFDPAEMALL